MDIEVQPLVAIPAHLGDDFLDSDTIVQLIKSHFKDFLLRYRGPNNQLYYEDALHEMARNNWQSFYVRFHPDLQQSSPVLARHILTKPNEILPLLFEVVREWLAEIYPLYQFEDGSSDVAVRFIDTPLVDNIRDLKVSNINELVSIARAVVTSRGQVLSQLKIIYLNCTRCGFLAGPFRQNSWKPIKPGRCPECGIAVQWLVNGEHTIQSAYQVIKLQEAPGTVPAGRVPRNKEVILHGDLVDSVRPGDEITCVGIYKQRWSIAHVADTGFPVMLTFIEANSLVRLSDKKALSISDSDIHAMKALSKEPYCRERIIRSIAPSIFAAPHSPEEHVKRSLALAMFGAVSKVAEGNHSIRGDINILIMGDPGCAKSQMLKYIEQTLDRVIFTSGRGASAAGLTAAVTRDKVTGEWTLEGGAMVLADKGLCLVDEFDKMNDKDRTSIHEAMEQQSISISKAGIVTTLRARCGVIAAANPKNGIYDAHQTLLENVNLSDPILSRFDIVCILRDIVDVVNDERLAAFVIGSHTRSHPSAATEVLPDELQSSRSGERSDNTFVTDTLKGVTDVPHIDQALLQKYIAYARDNIFPRLGSVTQDRIADFYASMRQAAEDTKGVCMTVRQVESILRLSVAAAKMELRDRVTDSDVDFAISVTLESFIQSQKLVVAEQMRHRFREYMLKGRVASRVYIFLLEKLFARVAIELCQDCAEPTDQQFSDIKVAVSEFKEQCEKLNMNEVERFLSSEMFKQHFRTNEGLIYMDLAVSDTTI